jgi:hypothetical protein
MNRGNLPPVESALRDVTCITSILPGAGTHCDRSPFLEFPVRWHLSPLLIAFVVVACGAPVEEPASDDVVVRDSAGVSIVTSGAVDRPLPWTFTEIASIGGDDEGPGAFTRAMPGNVGVDGADRIHVLDYDALQLHTFTADGAPVGSVGRQGGGPGEFSDPFVLGVSEAGHRAVFDFGKQAFIRWSAEGEVLPEAKWPMSGRRAPGGSILRLAGDAVLMVTQSSDSLLQHYFLTSFSTGDTADIVSMSRPAAKMQQFSCVGMMLPPLFTPSLRFGVGAGQVAVTREAAYVVDVFGPTGQRSIRRPINPAVPVPSDARRLYPEGMTVRFGGGGADGGCTTPAEEVAEKAGLAARIPLLQDVAIGRDGTLWVQRQTFEGETPLTDVFDAEGRYLGTLSGRSVPLGFLSNDRVLFGVTDPDTGVTRIGVFQLTRTVESERS